MKLRADQGLNGFINFLSGLNDTEKEVVIPMILEVKNRVMDCRQRRKEIRIEKAFTFRKFLQDESSMVKRKYLLDDWLQVSDFASGFPSDDFYSFLRRPLCFQDEDKLQVYLDKKIKELARFAGKWNHDCGRRFMWFKQDDGTISSIPLLDEIWDRCVFPRPLQGCNNCGSYLPTSVLENIYVELGLFDGHRHFHDYDGLWLPVRSLDASCFYRVLILVLKSCDDVMNHIGTFETSQFQNVFSTWTNRECLTILGGDDRDFHLQAAINDLLIDGWIDSPEFMELQSRSFFFEPVSRKRFKPASSKVDGYDNETKCRELGIFDLDEFSQALHSTVPDTASWTFDPIYVEALGKHLDFTAIRGFASVLHGCDTWNYQEAWKPECGRCFAVWYDCHSVSFFLMPDDQTCKPQSFFGEIPDFEKSALIVLHGNGSIGIDEPLLPTNLLVTRPLTQMEQEQVVRDLEVQMRSEQSGFLRNLQWKRLTGIDVDLQHKALTDVWSLHRFATARQLNDAWGLQRLSIYR